MALTKAKKAVQIDQLAHELEGSTSAIVGTFAKLTVSQDFELRKVVRGAGGRYRVLKNKLAARASKGTKVEQALQGLKGVSSVAYTSGDPVALAKALSTWMQENAEFTFKLGIVDGQVITVEEVKQLATMPSKEQIFAKLLFLINAPAQRLVTVMNAAGRDLAVVVNQAVEQGQICRRGELAAPKHGPPKRRPKQNRRTAEACRRRAVAPKAEQPRSSAESGAPSRTCHQRRRPKQLSRRTISPEAKRPAPVEDSQTAAAATEAPTERLGSCRTVEASTRERLTC